MFLYNTPSTQLAIMKPDTILFDYVWSKMESSMIYDAFQMEYLYPTICPDMYRFIYINFMTNWYKEHFWEVRYIEDASVLNH